MAEVTSFRFKTKVSAEGFVSGSGGGGGGSTPSNLAYTNVDNQFSVAQTFQEAVTIDAALGWTGVATGDGSGITDLNASQLTTGTVNIARLPSNLALTDANNNFSVNQTFAQDVTITGDLTVNGTQFITNTETVEIKDNLLLINNGETGAGVTAGLAGIEVDRGTQTNYQFLFEEASDLFKIGTTGNLQAVATRPDSPTNGNYARWNGSNNSLEFVDDSNIDAGFIGGIPATNIGNFDNTSFATNEYANWNGSQFVGVLIDYSEIQNTPTLNNYVTLNTDQTITAEKTFTASGNNQNIIINHTSGSGVPLEITKSSGSGIALDITKGGDGEGLRVNKTSGSGNAVTVVGTIASTGGNSNEWNTAYDRSIDTNPSFNTGNGVITFTQQDASTLTVDLDGRYRTDAQSLSFSLGQLDLTDSPSVDLQSYFDGRYVQSVNVYDGWNLSATTGGSTLIGENETVSFIDGLNTTATRLSNTIQIDAAFSETDTLDSVTDRGATTTNAITVGDATINGTITVNSGTTNVGLNLISTDANSNIYFQDNNGNGIFSYNGASDIFKFLNTSGIEVDGIVTATGGGSFGDDTDITGDLTVSGDLTVDTNTLFVDSADNRVGINELDPRRELHITGNSNTYLRIQAPSANSSGIEFADDDPNVGRILYDHADNSMEFRVNDAERMRIDSSGNVGIGTDSPSQKLEIRENAGQGTTPPTLRITNSGTYGSTGTLNVPHGAIEFYQEETSSNYPAVSAAIKSINENIYGIRHGLAFYTNSNSTEPTERMRIDSDGDVSMTGDLTVSGTISGNGSGLTSVNATTFGGDTPTAFARTNVTNSFTANQTFEANIQFLGSNRDITGLNDLDMSGNLTADGNLITSAGYLQTGSPAASTRKSMKFGSYTADTSLDVIGYIDIEHGGTARKVAILGIAPT